VDETGGFDAIILAGGASRRLGGADKAEILLGGKRLLDRALEAVVGARRVVVVGPRRAAPGWVLWTSEDPPGGGPAAALGAGIELVTAPLVVVLAVDMPFVDAVTVADAVAAAGGRDGAVLTDGAGAPQYLAGVYRTVRLRAAADRVNKLAGVPVRELLQDLELARLPAARVVGDMDDWNEIEAARRRFDASEEGLRMLDEWVRAVGAELGLTPEELDFDHQLDVARVVAHRVERRAAPVTALLIGLAAGRDGGRPEDVARCTRRVMDLARGWGRDAPEADPPPS
jgi:molybdopterin-guanine dinucleotide biosynthesis protein A